MEEDRFKDFVQECYKFYEHMTREYQEIIEKDSSSIDIKRIEGRQVISFNDTCFNIAVVPRHEMKISFNILK